MLLMKYLSSVIIALGKTSRVDFLVLPFFILGDNFFLKGFLILPMLSKVKIRG